MASTVPDKSQPLHNFSLLHLKWSKENHSNSNHRRRRSAKSPSLKSHLSTGSPRQEPPRQSPLRDSAPESMPVSSQQSLYGESTMVLQRCSPVHDDLLKHSLLGGESSKQSPLRDSLKQSPMRGDSVKRSPKRDLASESEASMMNKGISIEHRRTHSRNLASDCTKSGLYSSNPDRAITKSEKKPKAIEDDMAGTKEKRSKISLKVPRENECEENQQEETRMIDNNEEEDCDGNDEVSEEGKINSTDDEPKTWNLRPRKSICKPVNVNGVAGKITGSIIPDKRAQSPLRNSTSRLGENEANGGQKEKKRKLSVSIPLSKEEIEEDVFILTGSKPTRRPKKRAKNIQKHLDYVFPGLWLASITPDSYKVSENYLKG